MTATQDVDPTLLAAIERFFATQEAEDVNGYLSLWSRSAERPKAEQLKFVFDNGDDKFSGLTIERVTHIGSRMRVRLRVTRDRTDRRTTYPDGTPRTLTSHLVWSLTFVREGTEWKIAAEGTPADDLAVTLLAIEGAAERKALMEAEPDLLTERLLEAMSRRGDAQAQMGSLSPAFYRAAQRIYERVLETARHMGHRKAEGQALQNIANALYFQRQFVPALDVYEQRLALERNASDDEGVATALFGLGTVRYAMFEYGEALTNYRQALHIQERLDDRMAIANTLVSTGNVLYLQGDFDSAIADYRRSRELCRTMPYPPGEARALEGLGLVFSAQGDFVAALEAYQGVLDEGRARNDARGQGTALFSMAEIHFRLGNLETSRSHFDQSRALFEQIKDLRHVGRNWQGIALTDLVSSRFGDAEKAYVKSQEACTAGEDKACAARATVGVAFAQASQEHYDKAIVTYGKAIDAFTTLEQQAETAADRRLLGEEGARAEVGLSRALDGKKDHAAAVATATRARERATTVSSDDVLWRAWIAEARARRRLGEGATALAAAKEAVALIERMTQQAAERLMPRVAPDTVAAFGVLAILQAESGDAPSALATAERRRAHAVRLAIAINERDINRGMTPEERHDEGAIARELVSLQVQRDNEKALPRPDAERLARLEASISDAVAKRTAQQRRLFDRLPGLRRWRALDALRSVDAIAISVLRPDTVALHFVIDDEDVLVLTAALGEGKPVVAAHVMPVKRQTLAERVATLGDPATLRDDVAWRRAASEVAAIMPATILAQLAAVGTVIVIPDDVLWRVPFEALPIEEEYLADRASVTYAGSLAILAIEPEVLSLVERGPTVAVGTPELSTAIRERITSTAPDWTLRGIEEGEREIKATVAAHTKPGPTVLSGAGASEEAFRRDAERAALLHLAVPFRINSASPLFSPLLLSSPAAPSDSAVNGVLEAREIMNLRLQARSAIVTDGSAMSMRNGAAASPILEWAWLAAGVPSLILKRWRGDETTDVALIADVHARIRTSDAVAALHAAQAAVRKHAATSAPYYWAGWMAIGK